MGEAANKLRAAEAKLAKIARTRRATDAEICEVMKAYGAAVDAQEVAPRMWVQLYAELRAKSEKAMRAIEAARG